MEVSFILFNKASKNVKVMIKLDDESKLKNRVLELLESDKGSAAEEFLSEAIRFEYK